MRPSFETGDVDSGSEPGPRDFDELRSIDPEAGGLHDLTPRLASITTLTSAEALVVLSGIQVELQTALADLSRT